VFTKHSITLAQATKHITDLLKTTRVSIRNISCPNYKLGINQSINQTINQ